MNPQGEDRAVRLVAPLGRDNFALLLVRAGGAEKGYVASAEEFDQEDGRAFRIRRVGEPEGYRVELARWGDKCECRGHRFRGRCKHISALRALSRAGLLGTPAPEPDEVVEQAPVDAGDLQFA